MSDWTLIYETDSNGAMLNGSLAALRVAVLCGCDVKVAYSPEPLAWWSRYCPSVRCFGAGGATVVSAIFMEAADTKKLASNELEFEHPFALEYHIYNSTGFRKMHKSSSGVTLTHADESKRFPMRWYVKDYQVPWFLHADTISKYTERENS